MARDRVDISLSPAARLAAVGAGLLLVAMVVLLVAQLTILSDSRKHIVAQDRKINRIVQGTQPVLGELEPVADDARGVLRQAEPFVRELRAEMVPVLRDVRAGELVPKAVRAVEVVPELPPLLETTLATLRETLAVQRSTLSTQFESLSTQRATYDRQVDALRVNRSSRRIQKRTFALLESSLAIQQELLVHARSIDRKTGGPAPAAATPPPAAAPR